MFHLIIGLQFHSHIRRVQDEISGLNWLEFAVFVRVTGRHTAGGPVSRVSLGVTPRCEHVLPVSAEGPGRVVPTV